MKTTAPRLAIVTGASRGLGLFLCHRLLEQGYRVWGCSRGESGLDHPDYTHRCLDVGDEKSVVRFVREAGRSGASLEVLINNAGTASMNHLLLTPGEVLDRLYQVNYKGSFLFTREAAKIMMKGHFGRIVNFGSVASYYHLEGEAAYASIKAAVEELMRVSARELSPFGITVNAVAPCPIPTDLIAAVPKEKLDALVKRQIVPEYGAPEDVWNVVSFFLKEESRLISGQTLVLGGV